MFYTTSNLTSLLHIDNTSEIRTSPKFYLKNRYACTEMNEKMNNKKC